MAGVDLDARTLVSVDLEAGRRKTRRWIARISFACLVVFSTAILWGLVFSGDRAEIATSLSTAGAAVGTIFTFLTTIVLGYFGASLTERIKGK